MDSFAVEVCYDEPSTQCLRQAALSAVLKTAALRGFVQPSVHPTAAKVWRRVTLKPLGM